MDESQIQRLVALDHAHVWHPFTPMRQWRESEPLIIERGEGEFLVDARGRHYIDGVSSLWCNIHGHHVPELDQALREQAEKIAHTTMLGLVNVPATELAARLCAIAPGEMNKLFYTDSGATATEVAFKMAVGHWFHRGQKERNIFVAIAGAYHGDTTGSMSVGYSDTFHRPFRSMVFHTEFVQAPECERRAEREGWRVWPLEDRGRSNAARDAALNALEAKLREVGDRVAAVVVEPLVQGAAGILVQPDGYLRGVGDLCRKYGTLLIADEVATGFGRTGRMFACEHEGVEPDILCLGKGITGGYLPVAATLCRDEIAASFEGELHEMRTLYHGHTYTGNPLGCAVAVASLDLFAKNDLLAEVRRKAELLGQWLDPLRDAAAFPIVVDVRQRGLMVGIELAEPGSTGGSWLKGPEDEEAGGSVLGDFGESPALGDAASPPRRWGYELCNACRPKGLIVRPLGNVVVVMPPLAIRDENLQALAQILVDTLREIAGTV